MTSNRTYEKNIQKTSSVFKWTLDGTRRQSATISDSMSMSSNSSYSYSDNYNYLADTMRKQNHSLDNTTDQESFSLRADANSISNSLGVHSTNGNAEDNFKANLQAFKQSIWSLLELFKRARFKSDVRDSLEFSGLSSVSNDSNILSITSSQTPTTWTQVTQTNYFMEESETTSFSATGTAVTADGRELEFNVSVEMSRDYKESGEYSNICQYQEILTDPLVINLDCNPTEISDQKFLFDLNSDGKQEEIAQLKSNSGYLALDKDNNGTIDNGSELFGTKTGNGFLELSDYDSDNNGWIDENDEIYDKLKVWTKDADGNDTLRSLKDADVGAIYLGSAHTEFSMNDASNKTDALVRSTGVYLHEDGRAGTIQQVDF